MAKRKADMARPVPDVRAAAERHAEETFWQHVVYIGRAYAGCHTCGVSWRLMAALAKGKVE